MAETKSKLDSYYSKHYDERQLISRYRISFETMWLTLILIFISGMFKVFYGPWAADNTEMMVLLSLPTTYFAVRAVWKGAYFSIQQKSYTWTIVSFTFVGLLNLAAFIISIINGGTVIENGILSENLFQFFLALPFLALVITYAVKKIMSKNEEDEEPDE
ncbi:DUF6773 family protein [Methanimicrococcus blatticola]|uniref:Uncharacterized protein n=1 Tax=Methanimicrococcus blatticola TaxID=91560 RepID=A0A484F2D5_9EURY|nr:DUF6773 family protein [Methanimicrococcus blatticola]MBZ3936416.1 hypothetical protein [Methanimicrococcus blatticola]MCC2509578.1 hypothetical protein [Methanimicrococcus blatticola]TDQ67627.1 hypothetical protein C7391_1603 [Methanimicrococcus blatticola]